MAIKGRFPSIRPSLDLNFAKTKKLDPLITFTRASSGTYVGSDGVIKTAGINEARFDHSPTTGESLGLLVEEQRTNSFTYSEEFNDASWSKNLSTISANSTNSPALSQTADTLVEDVSNGEHQMSKTASLTLGATYTVSIYVKAAGRTFCRFGFTALGFSSPTRSTFNLSAGTIAVNSGGNPTITAVGSGWYRLSVTNTATSTTTGSVIIQTATDASTISYTGDGTSGIYLWGAQLEAGAFPTSYIPTTTATVTRSADVASITGANFSSWYRQDEGTFYGDAFRPFAVPATDYPLIADSRAGTDRIQFGYLTEGLASAYVQVGNVGQAEMYPGSGNARNRKVAFAAAVNNFGATCNGAAVLTDTSGTMPTAMVSLGIGSHTQNGQYLNGTIRRLTYWPQRLSNAVLQALTS